MTTPDELADRVARLYEDKWGIKDHSLARAAIAVALEEAAKVCEGLEPPEGNTYTYGMYWEDGAGACADAIRALKEKT